MGTLFSFPQYVDEKPATLSGYKRIYFGLTLLIIFGILNFTVLVVTPVEPSNHTPSIAPTLSPTLAPTLAPTVSPALVLMQHSFDGMISGLNGAIAAASFADTGGLSAAGSPVGAVAAPLTRSLSMTEVMGLTMATRMARMARKVFRK